MSEIWDSNSTIEEKESIVITPQVSQLRINFSVRDIDALVNKYKNNEKLDENDYYNLCSFLDSEYAEQFSELANYVKELFGDKLKDEYFRYKLENNKDNMKNQRIDYDRIYKYFIDNELDRKYIDSFKYYLYKVMENFPEIFESDMLSEEYKNKIDQVLSANEIHQRDLESAEFVSEVDTTDFLYQKKLSNENLKNEVLKDIPEQYSDLEKSIYIYIRLCQLLSYDPSYYADKNNNKITHQDFENVARIGEETTDVICYEFVTIYSELLKDMGLKVAATTKLDMDVDDEDNPIYTGFTDNHANLKYSVDDMVIFADSTTSVLSGDIINAKMNNPLNGLKCLSVEQEKKDEFNNALNKVYSELKLENSNFKKYGKDVIEKPLVEKLKILFDDISNTDFNSTDFISYITSIKHKLFTDDELYWNLKISFIGKNNKDIQYPVALFSINTNDIINVKQDTVQYLYDSYEKKVFKVEKNEIEELFADGKLFFIEGKTNIPNINTTPNNGIR